MVENIISKKTLKSLMRSFYKEVPKFLRYNDIAVMFHDDERDLLYTITFGDDEENEIVLARKKKMAKSAKELDYLETIASM